MWAVIILAVIIVVLIIALLIAYLDLRSTVEIMNKIMNDTIDSAKEVVSLNDQVIELNKQLYSKLYSDKEDDNNERE